MQANFIERAMTSGFNKMKKDDRIDPVNGIGYVYVTNDEEIKGTVEYI